MKARCSSIVSFTLILFLALCAAVPAPAQEIAVTSASPASAPQGTTNLDVTIGGKGFKRNARATFLVTGTNDPGGIVVNSTRYVNGSTLVANITVTEGAAVSSFDIQVQNADGRTGKGIELFSVTSKNPNDQPPPDPAIAYVEGGNLMVMNADGTNQQVVYRGSSGPIYTPDWSPDAARLVFAQETVTRTKGQRSASATISIVALDGTGFCTVASSRTTQATPAWSIALADGNEWIAYVDHDGKQWDLYAVRADCGNPGLPVKLTNDAEEDSWPSWSQLGTRFAASKTDQRGRVQVTVYDVQFVSGAPQLVNGVSLPQAGLISDLETIMPSWERNDDRLVFSTLASSSSGYDLWITDLTQAGTFQITFTSGVNVLGEIYAGFSPADDELVFMDNVSGTAVWKMKRQMNSDGTESWLRTKQLLPPILNYRWPRWRRCDPCP